MKKSVVVGISRKNLNNPAERSKFGKTFILKKDGTFEKRGQTSKIKYNHYNNLKYNTNYQKNIQKPYKIMQKPYKII